MYKQQFIQPILPTFEDVCKMPFHEPGFVENVPPTRFFAVVHHNYVGIYDNVKDVIDFLNAFQALRVKEFTDVNVAKWWINYKFMACIFPMGAYITAAIPYIQYMETNLTYPVKYHNWIETNVQLPPELSFPSTQLLLLENK